MRPIVFDASATDAADAITLSPTTSAAPTSSYGTIGARTAIGASDAACTAA
jgi:hypothetical protein